ncbi:MULTISPECIES: DUF488 family protein [Actinomyces]|uniref:DUF488 domain-containing protein n=1 Tax=Actinomyces respiraculi TaxID=2744574 RepID=A0A7T0LK56_9ACTO|nr:MULTISPECIES: DUF488 domain-containing protein [Actinomyces]QPL05145.1 DUF488 domain-containing protein [Actinomyces respiraculi]
MTGRLVGIGYQGRTLEDLVDELVAAHADRLIDVRLTPVSRVKGFSKSRLRDAVEAAGITYEHRPELGNPKDNRAGYARPGDLAARRAHERYYREVADSPAGSRALDYVATCVDEGEVVYVLCFERDHACCHRAQVIDEVMMRRDGLSEAETSTVALAG